jgi:putative transposase
VMRYVERNALRANLVERAEDWRWGTLFQRSQRDVPPWLILPSDPPLPRQWRAHVNKPQTEAGLAALRNCVRRGCPFGTDAWCRSSAVRLGLESSLRPRGPFVSPKVHRCGPVTPLTPNESCRQLTPLLGSLKEITIRPVIQ